LIDKSWVGFAWNLKTLVSDNSSLNPKLHEGVYVFMSVPVETDTAKLTVVASMVEDEGLTLVLPEEQAIQSGFSIQYRCAWITLLQESALDSVGLTAVFARALAEQSISCNVVAGTYHDHLFVPLDRADAALRCLQELRHDGNA